ncbi:unnamed protein product, partial [Ilex paraguariensis]
KEERVMELIRILQSYCVASGQSANFHKYGIIFFDNTFEEQKNFYSHLLGTQPLLHHAKYLGIPIAYGSSKSE